MSHFAAMKSPVPVAASATAADAKSPLFCPKPRRPVAPLRCHTDAGSGMDLLDLLLSKVSEISPPPSRSMVTLLVCEQIHGYLP